MKNIKTDEIIVTLIVQDLKFFQLVYRLEQVGLEVDQDYHLGIAGLVEKIMGVPPEKAERFYTVYMDHMGNSTEFPVSPLGQELYPLASSCFHDLKIVLNPVLTT